MSAKLIFYLITRYKISRLIDFILPGPLASDDCPDDPISSPPYEIDTESGYYHSIMDIIQLEMINQSEVEKYINTIISLQNSNDLNANECQDEGDGIINIFNDNYIDIQSYISFKVNPSGF